MTFWTVVFFLVVVGIPVVAKNVARIHNRNADLREREMELLGNQTAEKAAQYAAQTEKLEQRVRVLERIITDRSNGLSDEIEALRDQHGTDALHNQREH